MSTWPSSARAILILSSGRGAGPSKFVPSLRKPHRWQGHLELFLGAAQARREPKVGEDPERRKKAGPLGGDPPPLRLHKFLRPLPDREVGGLPRLEGGGRLEKDAREKQGDHRDPARLQ